MKILHLIGLLWLAMASGAFACTVPAEAGRAEQELFAWINSERQARGLTLLRPSGQLAQAAKAQSCDMARHGYFAHSRPGGPSLKTRINATGYTLRAGNENIAYTRRLDAMSVAKMWKNSPPHWGAIIDPGFRDVGLAIATENGKIYWTMVAAR